MALSAPRAFFGVHSVAPYNRTTGIFYGIMKVVQGSSLELTSEIIELSGGSQKFPWAVENGSMNAEMSLKVSQFEDFMFELFLGKAPTANAAEANGNVSTAVDVFGGSIIDVANGISGVSLTAADQADLKFGKYIIVATAAGTADVFLSSDVDFARGSDGSYTSDLLKIFSIDVSAATAVNAAYGLTFTKVGTPAFTVGHTAEFYVRPVNTKSMTVRVGASASQTLPEFGAMVYAQQRGDDALLELDVFRCKASGMPIGFEKFAFAETEIKVKCFYDSAKDCVFDLRHVQV
jgi:hypothetical protein